eukprot:TRINITY_DN34216_c0_g1_i1.p1 TRINITY_DN34216_c0_g1~~TRINITY_DN34216_c0_g1_i1.p1  ORF type:complete len:148 (+),score=44.14 TRINITY_DN34216_c0_g1_i1:56-445(+)
MSDGAGTAGGLLQRVAVWYQDGPLPDAMEQFLDENDAAVDISAGEQVHRNMDVYRKFEALIEDNLDEFCRQCERELTREDFRKQCELELADAGTGGLANRVVSAIVGGAKYDAFIALVGEYRREKEGKL